MQMIAYEMRKKNTVIAYILQAIRKSIIALRVFNNLIPFVLVTIALRICVTVQSIIIIIII